MRHDRREGAIWTRTQRIKNAALYGLARAALAVLSSLRPPWLSVVGRAAGVLAYAVFGSARRTAHANVARVLDHLEPGARRVLVRRTYARLGEHLGDALGLLGGAPFVAIPLEPSARLVLATALAEGRGIVFASAHLGPWERVAGSLVRAGFPLTTLAREPYDERFRALYDRLRSSLGVRVVYRGERGAAARIVRALKRGDLLGAPMDLCSRVPSIVARFLGHPARTAVGPARIALRTRAPVVVGTVARAAGGTLVISATRIETGDLAPGRRGEAELTARINDDLSARIRALPHEWVWMHPRWGYTAEQRGAARWRVTESEFPSF